MTIYYVDSAATGANDGTSWTDAYTSIRSAPAATNADEIRCKSTHVEAYSGGVLLESDWTAASNEAGGPIVISMNASNVYTTGAKLNATTNVVRFNNAGRYFGITFESNTGIEIAAGNDEPHYFLDCTFSCTTADDTVTLGADGGLAIYDECTFQFEGSSGDNSGGLSGKGNVYMYNPSFTNVAYKDQIFTSASGLTRIYGGDFSGWGSSGGGVYLVFEQSGSNGDIFVYGAKLPTTFTMNTGAAHNGGFQTAQIIGSDDDTGNDRYRFEYSQSGGDVVVDDTVYLNGANGFGPNDAPNNVSWRVDRIDADNSKFNPHILPPIFFYNTATGATKTITIELLVQRTAASPTAPQDDEIFAKIVHYDSATTCKAAFTDTSGVRDPTDTASNLSAGTGLANWTGEPSNSASYKLEIASTFDVDREGPVLVQMFMGGFSDWDAVYINPVAVIT